MIVQYAILLIPEARSQIASDVFDLRVHGNNIGLRFFQYIKAGLYNAINQYAVSSFISLSLLQSYAPTFDQYIIESSSSIGNLPSEVLHCCLYITYCSQTVQRVMDIRNDLADKAHGTIMGLTVVLIFPLGAMSRVVFYNVLSSRNLLRVHVGCQVLGLAMLLTGLGLGAWTAVLHDEVGGVTTNSVQL